MGKKTACDNDTISVQFLQPQMPQSCPLFENSKCFLPLFLKKIWGSRMDIGYDWKENPYD